MSILKNIFNNVGSSLKNIPSKVYAGTSILIGSTSLIICSINYHKTNVFFDEFKALKKDNESLKDSLIKDNESLKDSLIKDNENLKETLNKNYADIEKLIKETAQETKEINKSLDEIEKELKNFDKELKKWKEIENKIKELQNFINEKFYASDKKQENENKLLTEKYENLINKLTSLENNGNNEVNELKKSLINLLNSQKENLININKVNDKFAENGEIMKKMNSIQDITAVNNIEIIKIKKNLNDVKKESRQNLETLEENFRKNQEALKKDFILPQLEQHSKVISADIKEKCKNLEKKLVAEVKNVSGRMDKFEGEITDDADKNYQLILETKEDVKNIKEELTNKRMTSYYSTSSDDSIIGERNLPSIEGNHTEERIIAENYTEITINYNDPIDIIIDSNNMEISSNTVNNEISADVTTITQSNLIELDITHETEIMVKC